MVVESNLGRQRMSRGKPVQRGFRTPAVWGVTSACVRVVPAMELENVPVAVLHDRVAGHEIGTAQTDLTPRRETEVLGRRLLHEVVALDPKLAREVDSAVP